MIRKTVLSLLCAGACLSVWGQQSSRSGLPVPSVFRTEGVSADLPCAGTVLLEEDFEAGLGAWTMIDGDGLTPNAQMGLVGGWQSRVDYRDTTNHVAVTPSWYSPVGTSNDWLISPAITLGGNSCLSWIAYSQDGFFAEKYEVRVATSADTSAFLGNAALVTIAAESGSPKQRSASLSAYAGQTVYIAFRQTSTDKFVLALDDVKVTNVNSRDIGVYAATVPTTDKGDTARVTIQVANYGSDTVRSFQVYWAVENGVAMQMDVTTLVLAPNTTASVVHSGYYVSDSVDAFYDFCAWTSLPNGQADEELGNDSTCSRFAVGSPVGVGDAVVRTLALEVFPVPSAGMVTVKVGGLKGLAETEFVLVNAQGQAVWKGVRRVGLGSGFELDLSGLPRGMYLLQAKASNGQSGTYKLILR